MTENITEGQAKDMILEYCLQNKGFIPADELVKKLFPDTSKDIVNLLIEKIGNSIDQIADVRLNSRTKYIGSNGITKIFLNQGGFTQLEKNAQLEIEKKQARESKKDEILDLDIKLKTFESKIGRKLMYFSFMISFLSFLITVLTLEFWKNDEVTNKQEKILVSPLSNKKKEVQKDTLN